MNENPESWKSVRLKKPSGHERDVELSEKGEKFSSGTYGEVANIRARVKLSERRGGGHVEVPFVSKEYFKPEYDSEFEKLGLTKETAEERAGKALDAYKRCKKAGLPVPGTLRMESREDGARLVMSDLSEEGKYLVLSCNNSHKAVPDKSISAISNLDDVIANITQIATLAGQNALFLNQDAYLFMVNTDDYESAKGATIEKVAVGDFDLVFVDEEANDPAGREERSRKNALLALSALHNFVVKFVSSPEPANTYDAKLKQVRDSMR